MHIPWCKRQEAVGEEGSLPVATAGRNIADSSTNCIGPRCPPLLYVCRPRPPISAHIPLLINDVMRQCQDDLRRALCACMMVGGQHVQVCTLLCACVRIANLPPGGVASHCGHANSDWKALSRSLTTNILTQRIEVNPCSIT